MDSTKKRQKLYRKNVMAAKRSATNVQCHSGGHIQQDTSDSDGDWPHVEVEPYCY